MSQLGVKLMHFIWNPWNFNPFDRSKSFTWRDFQWKLNKLNPESSILSDWISCLQFRILYTFYSTIPSSPNRDKYYLYNWSRFSIIPRIYYIPLNNNNNNRENKPECRVLISFLYKTLCFTWYSFSILSFLEEKRSPVPFSSPL